MMMFSRAGLNNLHHAYLLIGDQEEAETLLHTFFNNEGITLTGSPDFFVSREATFGIDCARDLTIKASRKAFGERKVFLISPQKITLEAQNALLKTFEDPFLLTHFFLIVRDEELVLPTLRSRMEVLRLFGDAPASTEEEKFLSLSVKNRLAFAKKFADEERNLSAFLDNLLSLLRKKNKDTNSIEKVYRARLLSDDRGGGTRLVLEHLSLVLDNNLSAVL